ncbi:MAG: carbohydrate kinase family protein [Spirochaetota bacterium]
MDNVNIDPLNVHISQCSYQTMIGVGGVGTGTFFALNGNHTLGREESRSGHFIDRKDYCKLHIVSHYVKALLGPEFKVIPVGKVGDDPTGGELCREMQEAGLELGCMERTGEYSTLFSFCFIYPDGSGGNLTTDNSASSVVDAAYVQEAEEAFIQYRSKGIALAVPEVPLDARITLLELGTRYGFFRAASFTSEEIERVKKSKIFEKVDLLALNLDEAAALSGINSESIAPGEVVAEAVRVLQDMTPDILLSVTGGKKGSWCWDGRKAYHTPAYKTRINSTAGAGDAFLAGLIAGITAGLELHHAHLLGSLVAGLAISSPHTINKEIDRAALWEFCSVAKVKLPSQIKVLLSR